MAVWERRPARRGVRGSEDRMNRSWKTWLGAGLVGPALALGCNSVPKHHGGDCATCGGDVTARAPVLVPAPAPAYVQYPATSSYAIKPRPADVSHEMTAPPPAAPAPRASTPPAGPVVSRKVTAPAPATTPRGTGYHHSPDYTSLVGDLHYNPRQDVWRLRYADVGVEDRYGGSVTLENVGREMRAFRTGQRVRVIGELLDRNSMDVSPSYLVRDILPAHIQ
jgi:hypothetical protein